MANKCIIESLETIDTIFEHWLLIASIHVEWNGKKQAVYVCLCVCVDEHAFDYPSGTGDNSLMCIACILYTNNRFRMQ